MQYIYKYISLIVTVNPPPKKGKNTQITEIQNRRQDIATVNTMKNCIQINYIT